MTAARNLRDKLCDENYKRQFERRWRPMRSAR
jgi:hypothetical protein